jgi:hypothetical protein
MRKFNFYRYWSRIRIHRSRSLIVAAFPKAASKYVVSLLLSCSKQSKVINPKLTHGYGHNFLSPRKFPILSKRNALNLIVYGHFPMSQYNLSVISELTPQSKCIVLIRPLADIVISLADHINKLSVSPLDYNILGLMDGFNRTTSTMLLYDRIILFTLPWYIRFICSWVYGKHNVPVEISTFEENTQYPALSTRNILNFGDFPINDCVLDELEMSADVPIANQNFNIGLSGRGYELLSKQQLTRIEELVDLAGLTNTVLGSYLKTGFSRLNFTVIDAINHKIVNPTIPSLLLADSVSSTVK